MKTDNELIAEFMGLRRASSEKPLFYCKTNGRPSQVSRVHESMMKYHQSWDWLMPVVEKIDKLFVSEIDQNNKVTKNQREADLEYSKVVCLNITANISDVYKAVVEFIRWHNTQNQTK